MSNETNPTETTPPNTTPTREGLFDAVFNGLEQGASSENQARKDVVIRDYLQSIVAQHKISETYNLLILFDDSSMAKSDADNIYAAVTGFSDDKPILLTLYSDGGSAAAAYLIGKLCREHSKKRFIVAVPRRAKSAATLLACAADEIHMGELSELGPIDPQIDGMPALGLKNSVEHIAELTKSYPASSEMFSKYLSQSLNLINLGYYERVAESAMHYADRLLNPHQSNLAKPSTEIAKQLVYGYKDHGFVIDRGEALGIFGEKTIKCSTAEYNLANSLYLELKSIQWIADISEHSFYFIGSLSNSGTFVRKQKKRSLSSR
jgi:hypothetical protein